MLKTLNTAATHSDEAGRDEARYIDLQRKINPHADLCVCVCVSVCVCMCVCVCVCVPLEGSVSTSFNTAVLSLYLTSV